MVYMGAKDIERQKPNVFRMKLLGAEVIAVTSGSESLKDSMNEAMRDWVGNVEDTFYIIGTVAGPHPYPELVRDFQCVIGNETREQILEKEGRLPDSLVACVGGGSNAIGLFHPFLDDDVNDDDNNVNDILNDVITGITNNSDIDSLSNIRHTKESNYLEEVSNNITINDLTKKMSINLNLSYLVIAKTTMLNNEYQVIKETLFQNFKKIK